MACEHRPGEPGDGAGMQIQPIHRLLGSQQHGQLQLCVPPMVTRRRCQRSRVAGVTRRWPRSSRGRILARADRSARSGQVGRAEPTRLRAGSPAPSVGAVAVGVDQVVRAHHHAEHVDRAAERDRVHPGVGRRHLAAQHLELGRDRVQVAHAAVGDQALAAERLVDRGLHLAPEAAEADARIDVLDDHDLRSGASRDVAVVLEPGLALLGRRQARRQRRADQRRARVADHRRQLRERADQGLGREPERPALRRHQLEGVADGRRVEPAKRLEFGLAQRCFRQDPLLRVQVVPVGADRIADPGRTGKRVRRLNRTGWASPRHPSDAGGRGARRSGRDAPTARRKDPGAAP